MSRRNLAFQGLKDFAKYGTADELRSALQVYSKGDAPDSIINKVDEEGNSLLVLACSREGSFEDKAAVIQVLVEGGCNPRIVNRSEQDAVDVGLSKLKKAHEKRQFLRLLVGNDVCAHYNIPPSGSEDQTWIIRSWMKLAAEDIHTQCSIAETLVQSSSFRVHAALLVAKYFEEQMEASSGFSLLRFQHMKLTYIRVAAACVTQYSSKHGEGMLKDYLLYKVGCRPVEASTSNNPESSEDPRRVLIPSSDGVLTYQSQDGGVNALDLADEMDATDFFTNFRVQYVMDSLWHGGTLSEKKRGVYQLLISSFLHPIRSPINLARENKCWFSTPEGNYYADMLSYLAFILLFTVVVFRNPTVEPSIPEWGVYVLSLGFIFNEFAQVLTSSSFLVYIDDVWNKMDVVIFTSLAVSFGLRMYSLMHPSQAQELTRIVYIIFTVISIPLWARTLNVCSLSSRLGPMLTIFGKMFDSLLNFMVIMVVIIMGFSEALFGALRTVNFAENATEADPPAVSFQYIVLGLIRLLINDPQPSLHFDFVGYYRPIWGPIILGVYLVVGWIILLNLLIAILSSAYQSVTNTAEEEFNLIRSETILQYMRDAQPLPPPFNIPVAIVELLIIFIKSIRLARPSSKVIVLLVLRNVLESILTVIFVAILLPFGLALVILGFVFRGQAFLRKTIRELNLIQEWKDPEAWDFWSDRAELRERKITGTFMVCDPSEELIMPDDEGDDPIGKRSDKPSVALSTPRPSRVIGLERRLSGQSQSGNPSGPSRQADPIHLQSDSTGRKGGQQAVVMMANMEGSLSAGLKADGLPMNVPTIDISAQPPNMTTEQLSKALQAMVRAEVDEALRRELAPIKAALNEVVQLAQKKKKLFK